MSIRTRNRSRGAFCLDPHSAQLLDEKIYLLVEDANRVPNEGQCVAFECAHGEQGK